MLTVIEFVYCWVHITPPKLSYVFMLFKKNVVELVIVCVNEKVPSAARVAFIKELEPILYWTIPPGVPEKVTVTSCPAQIVEFETLIVTCGIGFTTKLKLVIEKHPVVLFFTFANIVWGLEVLLIIFGRGSISSKARSYVSWKVISLEVKSELIEVLTESRSKIPRLAVLLHTS